MKVLFLNPPFLPRFSREQRSPAVTKSGTFYYPKWLSYAAGVAIKEGHDVMLIDGPAESCPVRDIFSYVREEGFDAVVCDTSTPSIVNDLGIIDRLIDENPGIFIIAVGRHVSAMPEETFKMSKSLRFIAKGEYDYIVRDWLKAIEGRLAFSEVKGLIWREDNGKIIYNEPMPLIEDLDELPFVTSVYKRFLNIKDYFYGHSLYPLVVFDTSRGCPYQCDFCAYPQTFSGHKLRFRSIENVVAEFKYVAENFPEVKSIMLEDDTFIVDIKRTEKLAEALIKVGNKIPFDANSRYDVDADLEFFKKLKKAGARLFCVGFESGDEYVLKKMHKGTSVYKAKPFVEKCRKAGIMIHGCFMVGNLDETRESMQKTLDLAIEIMPDTAQFFPIMVYPGTRAYAEAKRRGWLATEDFSKWITEEGLHNSVVNLPDISHKELVEFCDYARRRFYTRPRYLLYKLKQSLANFDEFKRNLKGFKTLAKYLWRGTFGARPKQYAN